MEQTRPHPRLPFILLHVDRPSAEEIAEANAANAASDEYLGDPDLHASATIGGNYVVYPYIPRDADDETLFAHLAHAAERTFFLENGGGFLHLRDKAQEAAESGDLTTLCLLAEGFGYWRAVTEAHRRATRAVASSLDPESIFDPAPPPLSFFDALAHPPTILASYHEQRGQRTKANA